MDQVLFDATPFIDNPEPRCPVVLLLDTSGSMQGRPIEELNQGLRAFHEDVSNDSLALKRVEVAIVTFGPVRIAHDFAVLSSSPFPELRAGGDTPLGAAIAKAALMLSERKDEYRANGISYFRPWIFLITDGTPTDDIKEAAKIIERGEESKAFAFFPVGVRHADFETLARISRRQPLRLAGLRFRELFIWLSASMKAVSASSPGDSVPLSTPAGWSEV